MNTSEQKKWHVIYTRPRHEKKVASMYQEKEIEYYLPLVKTLKQWSDRKKKVEEVLFKSYIFVKVSPKEYVEALKVTGVVKYLTFEGKAAILSENQVETIRKTVENRLEFDISSELFQKGKVIKIKKGPLKDATGEVISWSGKKRLLIRIHEIGYSLLVQISPADLI